MQEFSLNGNESRLVIKCSFSIYVVLTRKIVRGFYKIFRKAERKRKLPVFSKEVASASHATFYNLFKLWAGKFA